MSNLTLSEPVTDMDSILPQMREFWKNHTMPKTGIWKFLKSSVELFIASTTRSNEEDPSKALSMPWLWILLIVFSVIFSLITMGIIFLIAWVINWDIITFQNGSFISLFGFIFYLCLIVYIDVRCELKEQGRSQKDYFKLAVPFGNLYRLSELQQRFTTDKIFRLEQIKEFLETGHIPKLLENIGAIKGKLDARIKQDVDLLNDDRNILSRELDTNQYLSDQDKQEFRTALIEIDRQLKAAQNDTSHPLYSALHEAEKSVERVREFNSKISLETIQIKRTHTGSQVAAKYIGYQSSLPKRLDEISDQVISELNEIIIQSNKVLTAAINTAPEVLRLNSGVSPVTRLLEDEKVMT